MLSSLLLTSLRVAIAPHSFSSLLLCFTALLPLCSSDALLLPPCTVYYYDILLLSTSELVLVVVLAVISSSASDIYFISYWYLWYWVMSHATPLPTPSTALLCSTVLHACTLCLLVLRSVLHTSRVMVYSWWCTCVVVVMIYSSTDLFMLLVSCLACSTSLLLHTVTHSYRYCITLHLPMTYVVLPLLLGRSCTGSVYHVLEYW